MAVSFKGTTAAPGDLSGSGALTPAFPANATVGDLAFLFTYQDSGTASGPDAAGWTVATGSPYGAPNVPRAYLWYKRLAVGDTAPTVTTSGVTAGDQCQALYITYSSQDAITPVEAASRGTAGTGTPAIGATVTPVSNNALLVCFVGRGDNETFSGWSIGGGTATSRGDWGAAAGADSEITIFDKVLASVASSGTATAVTSITDPYVSVMVALSPNAKLAGIRETTVGSGLPGSPRITIAGIRAAASASGHAGTLFAYSPWYGAVAAAPGVDGVRAAATAAGRPGTIFQTGTSAGVRATATAAGRPGVAAIVATGVRAAATATGRPGAPAARAVGVRAAATAAGRPGTVLVVATGIRASATAAGRPGVPVTGATISVAGVRAAATATGRPGSNLITMGGVRAAAAAAVRVGRVISAFSPWYGAVTTAGDLTVTGVRAAATAAGRPGTPAVTVPAVRATTTATGRPGSITQTALVIGVRTAATATVRLGTAVTGGSVTVTGVRAASTATGRPGTFRTTGLVTGVRAAATAAGRPGVPVAGGSVTVTGVRAAASATGRPGSLYITGTATGVRAASTATGRAGIPVISTIVQGVRIASSAAGRAGAIILSQRPQGVRAAATAAGRPGTASRSTTVAGVRAAATAAGRVGTFRITGIVVGVRAAATAAGRAGTAVAISGVRINGVRAATTATIRTAAIRVALGVRAAATATGHPSSTRITVRGLRAATTAAVRVGAPTKTATVPGVRAAATATGRPGTPRAIYTIFATRAAATATVRGQFPNIINALAFKASSSVFDERAGTGPITPAFPSSATAGDLTLLFAYLDSGSASGPEAAGWTVATGSPYGNVAAGARAYLWWRRLEPGDPVPTIDINQGNNVDDQAQAGYVSYASPAKSTPIDAISAGTQGFGSPAVALDLVTQTPGAMLVAFIGRGDNETFGSEAIGGDATGVVERVDQGAQLGNDSEIVIFDKTQNIAGNSGTATALTFTTDPWVSVMVALSPRVQEFVSGVRATSSGSGHAGRPIGTLNAVPGVRATATAAVRPGVVHADSKPAGVRAAAVASCHPGRPLYATSGPTATWRNRTATGQRVTLVGGRSNGRTRATVPKVGV